LATRKPKVTEDHSQVKALRPTDADTKYMGEEPFFAEQPAPENRAVAVMRSLTWYGRFYGKKDAREMLAQYLDMNDKPADAKLMRKVIDNEFSLPSLCWLSRMTLRGFQLNAIESETLTSEIKRLIETINKPTIKVSGLSPTKAVEEKEEGPTRQNIQEIMREKASEAAGELEGLFDEFITEGSKAAHKLRPIDEVAKKNVMPQHISMLVEVWQKKLAEFQAVVEGKDAQLVEGYAYLSKIQVRNIIKFIELVLGDLNSYISVKKSAKAPRARKAVPVEKIVSKLKYLKTFKDAAAKLDLLSVSPVKLHGASECYLYDTSKRKLIYLQADEYSKTFTIKGTTILGVDTAKSQVKTLRKPGESLPALMKLGKPAGRKFFDEIKSVGTVYNGRTNENIIILKAW